MFFRKKKPETNEHDQESSRAEGALAPESTHAAFDRLRDALIDDALARSADALRLDPSAEGARTFLRIEGAWIESTPIDQPAVSRLVASFRRACDLARGDAESSFTLGLFVAEWRDEQYDAFVAFFPSRRGPRVALRFVAHSEPIEAFRPEEMLSLF